MPTAAEVDAFQEEIDNLKVLMVAALVAHWVENVQGNPAEAIGELREFVTELVRDYGRAAAAIAVDFYNSARPAGAPAFDPVPQVRDDLLPTGSLIWATQPLTTEKFEDALDRLAAETQLATFTAAFETIGEASELDPLEVKFARYPQNPDPCAYCVLRASRGAIYWSEESATRGDHRSCGCKATMVFSDEPLPYMRAPFMAKYLDGAAAAEAEIAAIKADKSLSPSERRDREFKALLAGMRRAGNLR